MAVDPNIPWNLVAKLRASNRKVEIMESLIGDPQSASALAEDMDLKTNTVSNYIYRLRRMEPPMVVCITPEEPHHRLYAPTEEGRQIMEFV